MPSTPRPVLHNVAGSASPVDRPTDSVSTGFVDAVCVGGAGSTKLIKAPDPRTAARMTRAGRFRVG